ncbi:hypothetical protein [Streptomyces sp. NPDC047141]|uniref:hypothetical protein n=1 Tax=Streptomyces sp. NPDC047141 TaxID=3155738 RepID=UPI0033CFA680
MSGHALLLDGAAFLTVWCTVCQGTGPAAPNSGAGLQDAARRHLATTHPDHSGEPDDAFVVEPCRAITGWDGTEPPHETYNRASPPTW